MKAIGDIEVVNFRTGERFRIVVGDGESRRELKRGECGGLSCTQEMEDKMTPCSDRVTIREAFLMSRGFARNGRVIRKNDSIQ